MKNKHRSEEHLHTLAEHMDFYREKIFAAPCLLERLQYGELFFRAVERLIHLANDKSVETGGGTVGDRREKLFTSEELAHYDGSGGKPAYVAVGGVVYDVSLAPAWGGGTHFSLYAGRDLTMQFAHCHGKMEILSKLPVVGIFEA